MRGRICGGLFVVVASGRGGFVCDCGVPVDIKAIVAQWTWLHGALGVGCLSSSSISGFLGNRTRGSARPQMDKVHYP